MAPEYETFLRATSLLRTMQLAKHVEFGFSADGNVPVMFVTSQGAQSVAFTELISLLDLDPERRSFQLTCQLQITCGDLHVQMRSMTGVLNFNPNGAGVDVRHPLPKRNSGMPGSLVFVHQLINIALF